MKRTQASGGRDPDTGEAQDNRRPDGAVPSPARFCQCWGCRRHGREDGVPSGEWGLSTPFFFLFFLPLSLSQKHTHTLFLRSFLSFLSHKHTGNYSVSLSVSLWAPPLSLPHPTYLLWDLWRRQPCPTRDAKNGDMTSGQRTWATPPVPPHLLPLQTAFITSYAAHLKPIESLGGRECLTQISTSEGVSATLGNC